MSTIPSITEQDVRKVVRYTNFQRGQGYLQSGRVFDTRRAGVILIAKCKGVPHKPPYVYGKKTSVWTLAKGCVMLLLVFQRHEINLLACENT